MIVSLFVFLVYFLILREENEFDELIYRPLDDSFQKPNSVFLTTKIKEYESYGLNTEKLKEVIQDEKK